MRARKEKEKAKKGELKRGEFEACSPARGIQRKR